MRWGQQHERERQDSVGSVRTRCGNGLATVSVETGDGSKTFVGVAPRVGVGLLPFDLGPMKVDLAVSGAWAPAMRIAAARGTVRFGSGVFAPALGLDAGVLSGNVSQDGTQREVASTRWQVRLRLGATLGRVE